MPSTKDKGKTKVKSKTRQIQMVKTQWSTLKFRLFITYIDSKRKSSQRCQQPGPCPTHQTGWHQDKKGQVSAIQVVEIVCCRGANSRLQPSSFIAHSYALRGWGWTRTAFTFKTPEGDENCFITASQVRKGVGRRRPPSSTSQASCTLVFQENNKASCQAWLYMACVVTCSHLCTPTKTGAEVLPKS